MAIKKTDEVTDLFYGITFVLASAFSYFIGSETFSLAKTIPFILISLWGFRLAIYLFIRI